MLVLQHRTRAKEESSLWEQMHEIWKEHPLPESLQEPHQISVPRETQEEVESIEGST